MNVLKKSGNMYMELFIERRTDMKMMFDVTDYRPLEENETY